MRVRDTKEKIHLEEGEMICDKCEGCGGLPSKVQPDELQRTCDKCQGTGKVDWIENVVGKAPTPTGMFGSSSFTCSATELEAKSNIHDDMMDAMAALLAKKIDEEILESLINHSEQTNIYKTASTVFNDMGGILFDNRIIS